MALFALSVALVMIGCSGGGDTTESPDKKTSSAGTMNGSRSEDATEGQQPGGGSSFATIKASLENFCLPCHSAEKKAGGVDITALASADDVKAVAAKITAQVEGKMMPPANHPKQPSDAERAAMVSAVKGL